MTVPGATAAELANSYIAALQDRNVAAVLSLLAPDACSEFPFAPDNVPSRFVGRDVAEFISLVVGQLIERISIQDVEITEVSSTLAFVEMTSDCLTRRGEAYRNRYVIRVESANGQITLWREFFDPLATTVVR